ncbi:MAG: hypothetical protein EBX47_10145 [Synechococcaceae bacterium WB8_1B_057]|nr:hypothetical protein [Synechococcaceae bacterium WB6_1A_059]NDG79772.1 hypothetical protein [Synechococcaceae bacterium WB8_1B_057]
MRNKYGQIILNNESLFSLLYSGKINDLENLIVSDDVYDKILKAHKDNLETFSLPKTTNKIQTIQEFDKENQSNWFMPDNYAPHLFEELFKECNTLEQINRVELELNLFHKHKMIDLLYYLKYLVDIMRKNNIVWGVGRGSCVSSYILYLLNIHKIDSLKYNLDINEFFKEDVTNG